MKHNKLLLLSLAATLPSIAGCNQGERAEFSSNNTANKERTIERYGVDVNLDGKFDESDVEESKKFDFNYGVLTSRNSFSWGNLLPSLLKEKGVKIIGERSGGGSCSITFTSTTDGMLMVRSSPLCLCNASGDNIDSGMPVDLPMKVGVSSLTGGS